MLIEVSTQHKFIATVNGQILSISDFGSSKPGNYEIYLVGVYLAPSSRPEQEIKVDIELL